MKKTFENFYYLSSTVFIDFNELEKLARKYDSYHECYEMAYEVKNLREAIENFNRWMSENRDMIDIVIEDEDKKEDSDEEQKR